MALQEGVHFLVRHRLPPVRVEHDLLAFQKTQLGLLPCRLGRAHQVRHGLAPTTDCDAFTVLGFRSSLANPDRTTQNIGFLARRAAPKTVGGKIAVSFEKVPKLDAKKVVSCFLKYIEHDGASISRAEFESNLLEKLADPVFTEDISPLLVLGEHPSSALHPQNAGRIVMDKLIALIPGEAWKGGN